MSATSRSVGAASTMSIPASAMLAWCSRTMRSTPISPSSSNIGYSMKLRQGAAGDIERRVGDVAVDARDRCGCWPPAGRAERRPAPARRGGARHHPRRFRAAHGRAVEQPRCPDPGACPGRAQGTSTATRCHHDLCHPRPSRGDGRWPTASPSWPMARSSRSVRPKKCLQSAGDPVLRPFRRLPKGQRDFWFADKSSTTERPHSRHRCRGRSATAGASSSNWRNRFVATGRASSVSWSFARKIAAVMTDALALDARSPRRSSRTEARRNIWWPLVPRHSAALPDLGRSSASRLRVPMPNAGAPRLLLPWRCHLFDQAIRHRIAAAAASALRIATGRRHELAERIAAAR